MITNIEELKSEILRRGIARKEDLIGCEDRDLESIEMQYGKLPLAYKQIMKLLGRGCGKWLSEGDIALARAIYLNRWMREDDLLIDEKTGAIIISDLENVFFISGRYAEFGGGIGFIKTGENLVDLCVYDIDMAYYGNMDEWLGTIELRWQSTWQWIEYLVDVAEKQMQKVEIEAKAEAEANKSFWQKLFGK